MLQVATLSPRSHARHRVAMVLHTAMPIERSNDEWIRALRAAGPAADAARSELRQLLVSALRRVLSARGVDPSNAEDLAQEALIRIGARLESFRGESRFTSWALAVATRAAFDELRHQRWKDVSLEGLSGEGEAPFEVEDPDVVSPEHSLTRHRVLDTLRTVIDTGLTPRQREALVAELSGAPLAAIAEQMKLNRNALYKLTHDARRKLKAELAEAGITAAEARAAFEENA